MKPLWITRRAIEKGALALYKHSGWDRAWKDIAPAGRRRFRQAALDAIIAAIPNAVRQVGARKPQ
jgi:hypothetical protein